MDTARIEKIIDHHHAEAGALIEILLDIQNELHWVPQEAMQRVAARLNVPLSRVQHTATFYKAFSLVPKGRHEIHVCMGTACHVRGAGRVLDTLEHATGIRAGETDAEMKFSLETVNCVGCCALGPVVAINNEQLGKVAPARAAELLKKYE